MKDIKVKDPEYCVSLGIKILKEISYIETASKKCDPFLNFLEKIMGWKVEKHNEF